MRAPLPMRIGFRQTGQALVEFLLIAVALVPLFLLLPMIGKYQDLNHATQVASRYVAFDAIIFGNNDGENRWKPPAQIADEVRRRFYSNSDAPIKTGDVAGDFDVNRNLFWRDPYGNALIKKFSDVSISFGDNHSTSQGGGFSGSVDGAPFMSASTIGLAARSIYTGNVSVALANLPAGIKSIMPFDALNLSIERHTSLLFDPWSAPTTRKTEQRVGNLAPAVSTLLAGVSPVLGIAIDAVDMKRVHPPQFNDLSVWRDVVPADRLVQRK